MRSHKNIRTAFAALLAQYRCVFAPAKERLKTAAASLGATADFDGDSSVRFIFPAAARVKKLLGRFGGTRVSREGHLYNDGATWDDLYYSRSLPRVSARIDSRTPFQVQFTYKRTAMEDVARDAFGERVVKWARRHGIHAVENSALFACAGFFVKQPTIEDMAKYARLGAKWIVVGWEHSTARRGDREVIHLCPGEKKPSVKATPYNELENACVYRVAPARKS